MSKIMGCIAPLLIAALALATGVPSRCSGNRDQINALDARIADLQNSMDELGRAR